MSREQLMTQAKRNILIGAAGVAIVVAALLLTNPLRSSDSDIRVRLLVGTPPGTQMAQVKQAIEHEGWKIRTYSETVGYPNGGHPEVVVGAKHIRASLGDYTDFSHGLPFPANVTAFWGFDEQARLVDVRVWRTIDGP